MVGTPGTIRPAVRHAVRALVGHRALVSLSGEAGIRKTVLVEWLLAAAQERGALVLVGRRYNLSETSPYGPWVALFVGYPPDAGLPTLPPRWAGARGGGEVTSQHRASGRAGKHSQRQRRAPSSCCSLIGIGPTRPASTCCTPLAGTIPSPVSVTASHGARGTDGGGRASFGQAGVIPRELDARMLARSRFHAGVPL